MSLVQLFKPNVDALRVRLLLLDFNESAHRGGSAKCDKS